MESFVATLAHFGSATLNNPQGLIFFLFAVLMAFSLLLLAHRIAILTKGGDGKSLEGTIRALQERVQKLESHAALTTRTIKHIDARVTRSVQGVSVERFDPFQNAGGQQSFVTALLNESGDGVVISGIHARDGVRVYSKEIKSYESERELSAEEKNAIISAKKKLGA